MGFLTGAYGKLMAGKHLREIEYKQADVQRQLRTISRQIADKEKMYQAQARNMKQMMSAQQQYATAGILNRLGFTGDANDPMAYYSYINSLPDTNARTQFQTQYSMAQQQVQAQFTQANTMWENVFEMQRNADLNALKDIEADLQAEKDSLDSQVKIANNEYEMYKEQEKSGAQRMKPESGQD